jgi:hypothetical protein
VASTESKQTAEPAPAATGEPARSQPGAPDASPPHPSSTGPIASARDAAESLSQLVDVVHDAIADAGHGQRTAEPVTAAAAKHSASSDDETPWTVVLGTLFWACVGVAVLLENDSSREFLADHAVVVVVIIAAVAAIIVTAVAIGPSRRGLRSLSRRLKRTGAPTKAGLVLAFGFPLVCVVFLSVIALPQRGQLLAFRSVFLALVIFMPTVLWWLFIVAQRESLLNDFVTNLDRLGLLDRQRSATKLESPESRRTRISSYLQKFEANFVRIPEGFYDTVAEGHLPTRPRLAGNANAPPLATTAVPVYMTLVTLAVGWLLTLPPTQTSVPASEPQWLDALVPNPTPVTMAFLGAYFFSVQMLFRRYVRRDLRGSAYVAVVLRVVLAVIGTWVVVEIADGADWESSNWKLLTAGFVIGVFPKVAWQIVRSVFAKLSHRALPSMESRLPLSELDGLTVWHEARLEEEDIENVPNMATADLVDLLVSTRFPGDRIIDWVDQAILLTHLGADQARTSRPRGSLTRRFRQSGQPELPPTARERLSAHGVRTASELLQAAADADIRGVGEQFDAVLTDRRGESAIPSLMAAVSTNSNLLRVLEWRGLETSLLRVAIPSGAGFPR